jgi:hypothetical protein
MTDDHRHGTATMAQLFADQGHWDEAAAIYRRLLSRQPGREDLARALAEVEARRSDSERRAPGRDLAPLFKEWVGMLLKYDQLQKLRRISRRL